MSVAKNRYLVTTSRGRRPRPLTEVEHGFTHYSLTIYPVEIPVSKRQLHTAEPGVMWLNLADISNAALPAPVKKILLALAQDKR